jgi:subtilisin
VAGIAAALNNSVDVVGVAPNVHLWSANIEINGAPDPAEAACSVEVARVNQVFAVNMSFSLFPYTPLTDQIAAAYWQNGMFFAASAGNNYCGSVVYPANLSEVVAVAATTSSDTRASFSACGWNLELSAPGESILSTALPTGYSCASGGLTAYCSGTSMAAPHVAAAAAILKSYNSSWSNFDIRTRLQNRARPLGSHYYYGYGLLQVRDALL